MSRRSFSILGAGISCALVYTAVICTQADTIAVTNTNDSGSGSLPQALAAASRAGLEPTLMPSRNEPLEKYDNHPAPPRKIVTSPRMISQFGLLTSSEVHVDQHGK